MEKKSNRSLLVDDGKTKRIRTKGKHKKKRQKCKNVTKAIKSKERRE